ncbi:MAG: threonine synthase [Elusimicrobia bacterium]|nr:threonine synthase [Elusimicrobiota bacterium]
MKKILGFRCVRCAGEFHFGKVKYVCPACQGNLQIIYDYKNLKKRISRNSLKANPKLDIGRYLDILPLSGRNHFPPIPVGWTPLYSAKRLGARVGLSHLYLKDDGRNPSASFKDRASFVAVGRALETGEKVIAGASTGNAASSTACLAAGTGLETIIYVPKSAPQAKIAQILVFGAKVVAVDGTYDQAFDLCLKECEKYGWYNRNTGHNPFTREGKKTCSFEIVEQMGWKCPDTVFVPVGDGNIISGIWKGFKDFYELGLIDKLPRLAAVQAQNSDAIIKAFESGREIKPVSGKTIADSISVSLPRDGGAAVTALKESGGFGIRVSDKEILEAIKTIARTENVFAEPAGATAAAGLAKAAGKRLVKADEKIVILVTGNGLKDVQSAMKAMEGEKKAMGSGLHLSLVGIS